MPLVPLLERRIAFLIDGRFVRQVGAVFQLRAQVMIDGGGVCRADCVALRIVFRLFAQPIVVGSLIPAIQAPGGDAFIVSERFRKRTHAHAQIGFAKLTTGHPEETESHELEALHVSPRDTDAYLWEHYTAMAKLSLGASEEAVDGWRRSIELNRNYPMAHFYLAVVLAELGRPDEARAEAQVALALNPKFTIRRYRAGAQSDNPVYLKLRERLIEGMRKVGVPEE